MGQTAVLKSLGMIDLKSVSRDPLLRWMVVLPILIALLLRWGVPALRLEMLDRDFDVLPYYPLIASFLILLTPALAGTVIGFLLLDEREAGTLSALQVTPLRLSGYLTYRIALPILLSVVMGVLMVPVAGLVRLTFRDLLVAALAASPLAPIFALFLAGFAQNKVQGFALMKAAGVLNWPPIIAYFVPGNWQLLFGIIPLYWPAKVFWLLESGHPCRPYFLAGVLYQLFLLGLLHRRFTTVMTR